MLPKLLVATHNAGKVREIRAYLAGLVGEVSTQEEAAPGLAEAEETAEVASSRPPASAVTVFRCSSRPPWPSPTSVRRPRTGCGIST